MSWEYTTLITKFKYVWLKVYLHLSLVIFPKIHSKIHTCTLKIVMCKFWMPILKLFSSKQTLFVQRWVSILSCIHVVHFAIKYFVNFNDFLAEFLYKRVFALFQGVLNLSLNLLKVNSSLYPHGISDSLRISCKRNVWWQPFSIFFLFSLFFVKLDISEIHKSDNEIFKLAVFF